MTLLIILATLLLIEVRYKIRFDWIAKERILVVYFFSRPNKRERKIFKL